MGLEVATEACGKAAVVTCVRSDTSAPVYQCAEREGEPPTQFVHNPVKGSKFSRIIQ